MTQILLENARIFDGKNEVCPEGMSVLIEGGLIREISSKRVDARAALRFDVGGRTLMPGLIDLHIHAYASDVDVHKIDIAGAPYRTAHAARILGHALDSGFTTVRDVGGGDWSLWRAIQDGLIRAPRFFYVGKLLSMTGGHGDMRHMSERHHAEGYCSCGDFNTLAVIADGVYECIKAVREELRRGAHCIKIMGSGGVLSPTDPIWMQQYRRDEIEAIVNECQERRTYVSAHCHPADAVRRSVECGVRCIEHGTLIDDETARYVAEQGAYIVPTMAVIFALKERGKKLGLPQESQEKLLAAHQAALSGLEAMRVAAVKVGFGTDLLGETYSDQCREFSIRREVFSPIEILRQATSVGAEILMHDGKLGCVAAGACADLIIVDGDPLDDIGLLAQDGRALSFIMRGGEIVKSRLS